MTDESKFDLAEVRDEELLDCISALENDGDVSQVIIELCQAGALNVPESTMFLIEGLQKEKEKRGL